MFARIRGVLHAGHSSPDSDDYELLLPSSSDTNGHVSQPSNGSIGSSPYASRRRRTKLIKYIKHFCTVRRLLFSVALVPLLLIAAVLWSGIPPDFKDVREYERRLPQHNGNDAMEREDRYLRFPGHLWGHGLNNVLQEALLMSYLAYEANRSYVFEDYVWSHTPFSYTLYDFALRPARIPLNAFISGPTAGGPMSDVASAVSSSFFEKVCPRASRKVISSREAPTDAEGSMLIKWWVDKLATVPDRCVEVDSSEKVVFDRFLFGGPRILSILPGMFSSPILSRFSWSPLVLSAITRNFAVLRPQNLDVLLYSPHASSRVFAASSSLKQSASTDDSSSTSESHTSITTSSSSSSIASSTSDSSTHPPMFEGMLAVHIRRGDYKRHCPRLAQWHSNYMGIAQLPGLPDRFDPSSFDHDEGITTSSAGDDEGSNERDGHTDPEDTPHTREEYYLAHCLPSVSQIVKRLSIVRREHNLQQQNQNQNATLALPPLSKVYVLTNGWSFWLSQLFDGLKADGWEDVVSSFNVEANLDREQKYVGMAVDMAIAERAEVFVGNGVHYMPRDRRDAVEAFLAANPTMGTEDHEHSVGTPEAACVIQETPSDGMRMFANKDLECGDLIIQETPLVLFPLEHVLLSKSPNALDGLDEVARAVYMGLPNIHGGDASELVLGIFMTNKFEVYSTDDASDHSDRSNISAAVFKNISRMNHSCCPNVVRYWCAASHSMYVYAIRPILKGSPIVTAYCDPFLLTHERRDLLLMTYGISCVCPACTDSASDANRARIQNIQDNLAAVIQWALTPTLPDDLLLVPSLELLKLIEEEGLEGTEYYARVLKVLWYIYFVLEDFGAAGFYGRMLRAWKIANGVKKSDAIKEMQSELELIQYTVNRRRMFMARKGRK